MTQMTINKIICTTWTARTYSRSTICYSYRQATDPAVLKEAGNSPMMGIHMALRSEPGGIISVDEPVYVAY